MNEKIVLGIETSCDDTSIAIIKGEKGLSNTRPEILAFNSFSQEFILARWGGVVPEIAARNHLEKITPLLEASFKQANLKLADIDLIGVTTHPGLLGPLLTGLGSAKTMAMLFKKPIVPINHLYAHLEAIHLTESVPYPYLGLLISGGHTAITLMHSPIEMEILGTTIDDAAGEAYDKGGKILGLEYPAGKVIDDLAKKGDENKYPFPIGLHGSGDLNFSFSGVKSSLRFFLEKNDLKDHKVEDLCASYQKAIVEALRFKLKKAYQLLNRKLPLVVGGGVACNSKIREVLTKEFAEVYFVKPSFCTDNGAMIANLALRSFDNQIPYPECMDIDARNRFIEKTTHKENEIKAN